MPLASADYAPLCPPISESQAENHVRFYMTQGLLERGLMVAGSLDATGVTLRGQVSEFAILF